MSEDHHDDDKTQTHIPLTKDTMVGHCRIAEKIDFHAARQAL